MTKEMTEQLELQKEEALVHLQKGEALKRLQANPDYIALISEGFITDYSAKLGQAIAKNTGAYDSEGLCTTLKGINTLVGYTAQIGLNYQMAVQTIQEIDEAFEKEMLEQNQGE